MTSVAKGPEADFEQAMRAMAHPAHPPPFEAAGDQDL